MKLHWLTKSVSPFCYHHGVLISGECVLKIHWVNFLLHWANAWLVLLILHRLTARLGVALLAWRQSGNLLGRAEKH